MLSLTLSSAAYLLSWGDEGKESSQFPAFLLNAENIIFFPARIANNKCRATQHGERR